MGVAIPLGYVEDRASGALVVDGSLRFDGSKTHYLTRTPAVAGNRRTFTLSFWIKLNSLTGAGGAGHSNLYMGGNGSNDNEFFNPLILAGGTGINVGAYNFGIATTNAYFRDISAWYHIVIAVDTTQSAQIDKLKVYQNGVLLTFTGAVSSSFTTNFDTGVNNTTPQFIGELGTSAGLLRYYPYAQFSQYYLIDGQALDSSYFGYTDALTNTWRPKKLSSSVAFGTNGFFLPFDGSAPIGQDQSGRGNNWTPVNFGGSNTLEKATGALPILNTDGGGKVARVGVRTDSSASSLVLALPLVGIKSDFSNAVNSGTSNKAITTDNVTFVSTQSNFYGGSSFFTSGSSNGRILIPTGAFDFGTGDYTIEFWAYLTGTGDQGANNRRLITAQSESGTYFAIYIASSISALIAYPGGSPHTSIPNAVWQNKWTHFAYTRSGGTSYQFINGVLNDTINASSVNFPDVGYQIGRYDSSNGGIDGYLQDFRIYKGLAKYTQNFIPASTDPDILPDTPSGVSYTSNLTQITDGAISSGPSSTYLTLAPSADFGFGTGDFTVEFFVYETSKVYTSVSNPRAFDFDGTFQMVLHSTADGSTIRIDYADSTLMTSNGTLFVNKWNHIALVRSGSTLSLYINGVFDKSVSNSTNVPTPSSTIYIGRYYGSNSGWINGFLSNFHVVKGTALYTSNFTPPTGPISSVANTKLLCCKSNSSATAFDVSPGTITANGNAAATNFNPFTVNINTQRGKQSGWCTLNPLDVYGSATFSNGNLTVYPASGSGNAVFGSLPVTSGKWYWEVTVDSDTSTGSMIGITDYQYPVSRRSWYSTSGAQGWLYYTDGSKYTPGNPYTVSSYGSSYTTGAVIGVALDMNAGNCTMYKNNVSQGTLTSTGLSGNLIGPALGQGASTSGQPLYSINFGQKPFKFPPPAGFQPLALANTPRPTIVRPDQFVGVTTYTGTGAARSINTGFKPDFVWIKERGDTGGHVLYDTVRGATKYLATHSTNAEATDTDALTSFNSNGFSLGSGYTVVSVNGSTRTYVGWAWKAGGNSNTYNINDVGYATASAAGLTAGTITPTGASVNTKSGFSVVTFTAQSSGNATIGHGLGVEPHMIIVKSRADTYSWLVYHKALTSNAYYLILNSTAAQDNTSNAWNSTTPTSTVFTLGSTYAGGGNSVAYCFAPVSGYSSMGSYVGNGSADGPFVYTGFRPRFLMIKRADASQDWIILDAARNAYNVCDAILYPNANYNELYAGLTDFLSNGFKHRFAGTTQNTNGGTYIYMAFAETPTQNLYGAQANAR